MSETLSIIELLETARQKLGAISACLNDSQKFANEVTDFDSWLKDHSHQLSSASELDQNTQKCCRCAAPDYPPGITSRP